MSKIKTPAVAGMFYPSEKDVLIKMLDELLSSVEFQEEKPKAIIAPHAGYIYSGIVAASAYKCLEQMPNVKTIVLLGPAHFASFTGVVYCDVDAFNTPLGDIPVNLASLNKIKSLTQVNQGDKAFHREHCLEVQLPFIQYLLPHCHVVPLLVGTIDKTLVAEILENLWGHDDTLIVISSDLSHYNNYTLAQAMDENTTHMIEDLAADKIGDYDACGRVAIRGLLHLAKAKNMRVKTLMQINSGDTAGNKNRVVGYGAYHFYEG